MAELSTSGGGGVSETYKIGSWTAKQTDSQSIAGGNATSYYYFTIPSDTYEAEIANETSGNSNLSVVNVAVNDQNGNWVNVWSGDSGYVETSHLIRYADEIRIEVQNSYNSTLTSSVETQSRTASVGRHTH